MRVVEATNIEDMKHVALEWEKECNCAEFGMKPDVESFLAELKGLITAANRVCENQSSSPVLTLLRCNAQRRSRKFPAKVSRGKMNGHSKGM